jgi:hypothetical protein
MAAASEISYLEYPVCSKIRAVMALVNHLSPCVANGMGGSR